MQQTTIAAIATAPVKSGLGVIRISGPEALRVAGRVFQCKNRDRKLADMPGHTVCYGVLSDRSGQLDDGVATVFRAPRSYTGEDVVEFSCHGGVYSLKKILAACFDAGAEPAMAGEFTKRAFLNGKLDLTEAEAVADLIEAEGERALKAALCQKDGALHKRVDRLADRLKMLCSHLAAVLDFPEEDVEQIDRQGLLTGTESCLQDLTALIATYHQSAPIRDGVTIAIVGKPNVGKSSLLNSLAGQDCAIVTDIAGTTRDVVSARMELSGLAVTLLDTAGIRETEDVIEAEGVRRSKAACDRADLILAVFDRSAPLDGEDELMLSELAGKENVLCILSKKDRPALCDKNRLKQAFHQVTEVSSVTGQGTGQLLEQLRERLRMEEFHPEDGMIANERQLASARQAADCCRRALEALEMGMTFDAVSVELEQALGALYTLSGKRASDSIIEDVFSRFCVGK